MPHLGQFTTAITRHPLRTEEQDYWQVQGGIKTLIKLTQKKKNIRELYTQVRMSLFMLASGANEFRLLEDITCVGFQLRKSVF